MPAILIIGIVEKASFGNIHSGPMPIVFRPMLQEPKLARIPVVSVRTTGNLVDVEDRLRRTVASLGREYVRDVYSMEEYIGRSLLQERLLATLSSFFAGLAVVLAFIGVYGLLAYATARRHSPIARRSAQ